MAEIAVVQALFESIYEAHQPQSPTDTGSIAMALAWVLDIQPQTDQFNEHKLVMTRYLLQLTRDGYQIK